MISNKGYWLDKSETDTHDCDIPLCTEIIKLFREEKTFIDIGCGAGGYTKRLIQAGYDCQGFDGCPLTPEITDNVCKVADFADPQDLGVFDVVLSLEVGEHIPKEYEQIFIDNLVRASKKYIVISWGVVGQPGIGHVNCQNNDYVIAEIEKRGFIFDKKKSEQLRKKSTFPWFANTVMVYKRNENMSILNVFKGFESSLVSVVLTSCGRLELLKRTVDSFNKYNTFPIHEFIIVDDSGNKAIQREIRRLFPKYTHVFNPKNLGLIESIDRGYSQVKTHFVMHLEEDWEFYQSGFIEKSLQILLEQPKIMMVWVRALNDTNGHPIEPKIYYAGSVPFRLTATNVNKDWHGWSFNPGLRRMSDYYMVAPYSKIAKGCPAGVGECLVGQEYYKLGFRSAILMDGYCFHIGGGEKTYSLT